MKNGKIYLTILILQIVNIFSSEESYAEILNSEKIISTHMLTLSNKFSNIRAKQSFTIKGKICSPSSFDDFNLNCFKKYNDSDKNWVNLNIKIDNSI